MKYRVVKEKGFLEIPDYEKLVQGLTKMKANVILGMEKFEHYMIVAFLVYTGRRVGEIIKYEEKIRVKGKEYIIKRPGILVKWIDFERGVYKYVPEKKKKKELREAPLPGILKDDLIRYINMKNLSPDDTLFNYSRRAVNNIVEKFGKKYVNFPYLTPHLIRHSLGTFLIKNSGNIELVRRILGHSDYRITQWYLNLTVEDLKGELEKNLRRIGIF